MSAVESPRPVRRATQYTFVAQGGTEDGIEVGDRFTIEFDGECHEVKVVDVSEDHSVLEQIHTGLDHYGPRSLSSMFKRL